MSNTDQTVIAVVDDDLELGSLIGEYLQSHGRECELFESGERFLESDYSSIALLVLDVGLPGMDGFARDFDVNLWQNSSSLTLADMP